jgi:2-polyprenyl-3-methyl-5-hydroxy-6-metoxy-1,4-benzoquinol methylase
MKSKLDDLASAYKEDAEFSLDNKLITSWYPNRVRELSSGTSILELGIGHGYSNVIFSKLFKRHVILEGSKSLIDYFRNKNLDVTSEIIEVMFEDFNTDEKFDVIALGFVLEHVKDPQTLLKKYKKFLKTTGKIIIAVPNAATLPKRIGIASGMIKNLMKLSKFDKELGHYRLYTVDTLRKLVSESGICEEKIEGIFLKTVTSEQLNKLKLSENILQGMMQVGIAFPELCVGILMSCHLQDNKSSNLKAQ